MKTCPNCGFIICFIGQTKEKIIDLLKKYPNGTTTKIIQNKIGYSYKTIWQHLRKLETLKIVTIIKNDHLSGQALTIKLIKK